MKVFVTGATGFIGFHTAKLLREKGYEVVAITRESSGNAILRSIDVEPVIGDVRDYESILRAIKGCSQIYHLAADYRLWVPDPQKMYDINVQGTKNIMMAAAKSDIEKVIYTSTVGVLALNEDGTPSNEESYAGMEDMIGYYKKTKFIAEQEVFRFIEQGLPVVIVNPSTPIGPMDRKPTPTGMMIVDFMNGRMPAYLDTGLNFVDVEDVATGHWLASNRGKIGERYILGNMNITLGSFLKMLAKISGKKAPNVRLPYYPILAAAYVNEAVSVITRRQPRIPVTGVKMAHKYMYFDSSKAVKQLGMPQSSIEAAAKKAVEWFMSNGFVGTA